MYSNFDIMSSSEMIFKDKDNFHYRFPQNSCKRCLNYPCLEEMNKLKSDFAKFGCRNFNDSNIFHARNSN
jgi:hypothetical protein